MVMFALCVLGIFSYAKLGVEQLPDLNLPIAYVDVLYPGASPQSVEEEITKKIEEALNGIAGAPAMPLRASSIFLVISSSTDCGDAPGYNTST